VLNKVALSVQVNMKADLREIYGAPTRRQTFAVWRQPKKALGLDDARRGKS
jgi:hypothetical protein